MTTPTMLRHNHVQLALHTLSPHHPSGDGEAGGIGHPLLLLHGLGERSPDVLPAYAARWPGSVHALDFTGHGSSTVPTGGGYTAEMLMADADAALDRVGPATVVGRGLGGYVALLLAGARPRQTRGVIIADGPGTYGGFSGPATTPIAGPPVGARRAPDPFALLELSTDPRPPEYALTYAGHAVHGSDLTDPIAVTAIVRPPWLAAVIEQLLIEPTTLPAALARYAGVGAGTDRRDGTDGDGTSR